MSTYVMSDIHGCYDEMIKLLKEIDFSKNDRLILAGDYIDRGTQNLEMLNWIQMKPENVIFLRGNHEEEFAYCIELMRLIFEKHGLKENNRKDTEQAYELLKDLASGSGTLPFDYYGTIGKLIYENAICMAQLNKWDDCIRSMPYVFREEIKGKAYVVVHAGFIESLDGIDTEENFDTLEDFYLYARDDAYMYGGIPGGIVIAGHTPTIMEEELPYNDGKVYQSYDEDLDCTFYNIDCGVAYQKKKASARLACIRLDDEKIFYGYPQ